MGYYKDLREHIKALEANGKLVRIRRPINKDTELMPLVRWQFRGLPEEQRKAFLFENVVGVKGRKFGIPILVGSHSSSKEIYALGMMCAPDKIMDKWTEAQLHPIEPRIVDDGPVHEEVHVGGNLLEHGGLEEFPVPISTPGFDNAPYFTCANWVTKDPETGRRNIGNYRAMIKSRTRTGIFCASHIQHLYIHWQKCKKLGKPLQAAIVMGATPAIGYASVTKIPYGVDEYAVVGGIAGEPIELVKCKTVDIEVPATAEIVIEGELPTDAMEREAPFGEFTGYMGEKTLSPYFNVTCITHRRNPIYSAFLSQFTPSEASVMFCIGHEATVLKFLRHDCGLPVLDVALHQSCGGWHYCVIKMKLGHPAEAWQALHAVAGHSPRRGKITIVVDDDIDARNPDSVNWALAWRMMPDRDIDIIRGRVAPMDYSATPPGKPEQFNATGSSALLINATRKWAYPPVSLPKKQFMERAKQIWEQEGLPKLTPQEPWFGYSLGYWTEEDEQEAELALQGEHFQTGEKYARERNPSK